MKEKMGQEEFDIMMKSREEMTARFNEKMNKQT